MKICILNWSYTDIEKLQNINGSQFETKEQAIEALKQCAYTELEPQDDGYQQSIDESKREIEASFKPFDSIREFAEYMNGNECDVRNTAYVALQWQE